MEVKVEKDTFEIVVWVLCAHTGVNLHRPRISFFDGKGDLLTYSFRDQNFVKLEIPQGVHQINVEATEYESRAIRVNPNERGYRVHLIKNIRNLEAEAALQVEKARFFLEVLDYLRKKVDSDDAITESRKITLGISMVRLEGLYRKYFRV